VFQYRLTIEAEDKGWFDIRHLGCVVTENRADVLRVRFPFPFLDLAERVFI